MSVTAVPLRPVNKGGLWLLWIGLAVLALVAAAVALHVTRAAPDGLTVIKEGTGASPTKDDIVLIKYVGKLDDGTVFDQNEQAPLPVAEAVPGFRDGLMQMKKGGHYRLVIPPELGYGDKAVGPIPANSRLTFDVQLLDFRSRAEVEAQMRAQMEAMGQGGRGGPPPGMPGQ